MKNVNFYLMLCFIGACVMSSCSKKEQALTTTPSSAKTMDNAGNLVLTPYGYIPADHVHAVTSSTYGTLSNGHIVIKELSTGKVLQDYGTASVEDLKAGTLHVDPYAYAAKLRSQYNVISTTQNQVSNTQDHITSGNVAGNNGSQNIANVPNNTSATAAAQTSSSYVTNISGTNYSGYLVYVSMSNIQSFSTNWVVPAKPMDNTNLVTYFFWNALDLGAIQPVLEWDNGRGSQYAIRCWYFVNGHYFFGNSVNVDPGTSLQGVVNFVSNTNDTTWTYTEGFTGYSTANVTVVRKTEATTLTECFEPYTSLMTQWPNQASIAMTNINVTLRTGTPPATLSWLSLNDGPRTTPTGANSVIVNTSSSNGEVDFYLGDGTGITPDSTFQIVSAVNGTSLLDVYASQTTNGTKVELWSPNSPITKNQEWVPISLFNGYYKIASKLDTTKVLEVAGGSSANGAQVDISSYTGASYQQWKITPLGNGYCSLSPANASSSALDDNAQGTTNGNKIQLYTANNTVAQQWKFNYIAQ